MGTAVFTLERDQMEETTRCYESIDELASARNRLLVYKLTSGTLVSVRSIRRALAFVIKKHITLRTALTYDQSRLVRQIVPISGDLFDVEMTCVTSDDHINAILRSEKTNRSLFNFKEGIIFRCHLLYRTSNTEITNCLTQNDIIIFNFHHEIVDNNSMPIFINDFRHGLTLQELYDDDKKHNIDSDNSAYERFDQWFNTQQYFTETLKSSISPSNKENKLARNDKHFSVTHTVDYDIIACLTKFISESNTTFFELSLATFFAFLFKSSENPQNLCTAVAVDNRAQYGLQDMIGAFTNIIPCQLKIDPYESFVELCGRLKKSWSDVVMPYSHLSYQEIIKHHRTFEISRIRTLLIVQSIENHNLQSFDACNEVKFDLVEQCVPADNYPDVDMIFTFLNNEKDQKFSFTLNGSLDAYEKSTIITMAQRLQNFFSQLLSAKSIRKLSVLIPEELELIYSLNSDYAAEHIYQSLIDDKFLQQAIAHPQKVSVMLDSQYICYGELHNHAQYLAQYLATNYEIKQGDIVTQYVNKSIEMVIGILAILMTGAIYCPLSPEQPIDRVLTLIDQTQSKCTLAHSVTAPILPFSTILIDHIVLSNIPKDALFYRKSSIKDVAYIIFTSGSTGIPKGVKITHQNFGTCVQALQHKNIISNTSTVLQVCSVTFDIHILEIFGTLWSGGSLTLLRPDNYRDINYILSVMEEKQISTLFTVPTIIAAFVECLQTNDKRDWMCLSTLRMLGSGGEALFPTLVDQITPLLSPNTAFYNFYGPAECTPISSTYMVNNSKITTNCVSIGHPLPGYKFRILDEYLESVIPGQSGELFIGGNCVFEGYLHQSDLTDKFRIELEDGDLYYQTGDLVRLDMSSRTLFWVGRKDFQIKLRGQRIELGEIESVIMKIATGCAVIKTMHDNDEHLVAYVETKTSPSNLRHHCMTCLPLYMVPSIFLTFDKLPINQNGKIDRKALPPPDFSLLFTSSDTQEQPLTDTEHRVGTIWCQILGHLHSIPSKSTSFFSVGGNSLSLMKLYQKYQTDFSFCTTVLTFDTLFQQPTIEEHARLLAKHDISESEFDTDAAALDIISGKKILIETYREREEWREN